MKHSNLYIYMYRYREQLGEGGYNIGKKDKNLGTKPKYPVLCKITFIIFNGLKHLLNVPLYRSRTL